LRHAPCIGSHFLDVERRRRLRGRPERPRSGRRL
jgi:hypothetical protein